MLSIFLALVFCQWDKDKTLSIFPFRFSMRKCRYGIAVVPERQPERQYYCNPPYYSPHLPWWLKCHKAWFKTQATMLKTLKEHGAVSESQNRSWRQRALAESSGKQILLALPITFGRYPEKGEFQKFARKNCPEGPWDKRPDIEPSFLLSTLTS